MAISFTSPPRLTCYFNCTVFRFFIAMARISNTVRNHLTGKHVDFRIFHSMSNVNEFDACAFGKTLIHQSVNDETLFIFVVLCQIENHLVVFALHPTEQSYTNYSNIHTLPTVANSYQGILKPKPTKLLPPQV